MKFGATKINMLTLLAAASFALPAVAVSPAAVERGRQLFERNWQAGNPAFGSDGLGPLFNGRSCVVCHHQSGVGGGGESEFNAKTIGIEQMSITGGVVTNDVVARMVSTFHPGFVQPGNLVQNTLVITHHGGSRMYDQARKNILSQVQGLHSEENGGPLDAQETRRCFSTPILFANQVDAYKVVLKARLFHRNTTSLFGAGLLDQIPDSLILAVAKSQKTHPEISGRPATLRGGRIGKFGWRGNVASLIEFNDQACANEVGLETRRKPQARDPMVPNYRNPTHDVEDEQIKLLNAFVAALPAPVRRIPEDSLQRSQANYGEQVFSRIGCADCHVPDMGPAKGIYSDILLHDMGYELMDLNHAEPYRIRATPAQNVMTTTTTNRTTSTNTTGYYGGSSSMSTTSVQSSRPRGSSRRSRPTMGYTFVAPTYPEKMRIIDLGSETRDLGETVEEEEQDVSFEFRRGSSSGTRKTTTRKNTVATIQTYVRVHYEQTKFNQEWRTPPLWGVADSPPYMHDGRAQTLLESIAMHDGEAAGTRDRFLQLPIADRMALIAFLETLVAPPNVPRTGI